MRASGRGSVVQLLSTISLAAIVASTAAAQTLGELAKQEEARRRAIKKPGRVLTSETIQAVPAPPIPVPSTSTPSAVAPNDSAAPTAGKQDAAADPKAQETTWRKRMQDARDALQRSQMFAEALQSRINGLTADFTARDDPAQRAVVANDRQKALSELDRVKDEISKQTKAIADIQEEARKSNIPPGWLR